jgi:hypothetical protein
VAGRTRYTAEKKAEVYVVLTANAGNTKRTSRETLVPEATIRMWKKGWEVEPPNVEDIIEATGDFVEDAKRVRNKALMEMERKIPEATPSALVAMVGVLTEKIALAQGLATRKVEVEHTLPSPEEMRDLMQGFVQGAISAAKQRQEDIIDAELVALPA